MRALACKLSRRLHSLCGNGGLVERPICDILPSSGQILDRSAHPNPSPELDSELRWPVHINLNTLVYIGLCDAVSKWASAQNYGGAGWQLTGNKALCYVYIYRQYVEQETNHNPTFTCDVKAKL